MDQLHHPIVAIFLIALAEMAIMLPLLRFLHTGWFAKQRDIVDGLDTNAYRAYFKMFCRNGALCAPGEERPVFLDMYDKWYGRQHYKAPGMLLFAVSTSALTAVIFSIMGTLAYTGNPFFPLSVEAIAALSGAYMWVVDDHISRARRLDMTPSDLLWGTLRLLIAIPMGYAFKVVGPDGMAPFIAFALGAFPIEALTNMLRRTAYKLLRIEPKDEEVSDGVVKLQGTDRSIVDRLAVEDIRTVAQMAYCDPVHTTMRTNLTFNFVTDLMNQALVRMYFREKADLIAPLGLRGAVEVRHFIRELDAEDPKNADKVLALNCLPKLAEALGQDACTTELAFRQIALDPYTVFLFEIWTSPEVKAQLAAAAPPETKKAA